VVELFSPLRWALPHVVGDAPQLDFSERHPKLFDYYNSHHKKLEE
jgi:hypothetical protein